MNKYNMLKNRITNGKPYLKETAKARADYLLCNLEITQDEYDELAAIIDANGVDILPDDALGRLTNLEQETDEITLLLADIVGGAI